MNLTAIRTVSKCCAPFTRKIANGVETSDDGRTYVEKVNIAFLREGGSPDEYRAGIEKLKADGLIDMHDGGAFQIYRQECAAF